MSRINKTISFKLGVVNDIFIYHRKLYIYEQPHKNAHCEEKTHENGGRAFFAHRRAALGRTLGMVLKTNMMNMVKIQTRVSEKNR